MHRPAFDTPETAQTASTLAYYINVYMSYGVSFEDAERIAMFDINAEMHVKNSGHFIGATRH